MQNIAQTRYEESLKAKLWVRYKTNV